MRDETNITFPAEIGNDFVFSSRENAGENYVKNDASVVALANKNQKAVSLTKSNTTTTVKRDAFFVPMDHEIRQKQRMVLNLLKTDDYVEGEMTRTQLYFEGILKESPFLFREVFQNTWLYLFKINDVYALRKFICISSNLEYNDLKDKADAVLLAASVSDDYYVNEAVLRAAEAWGNPELASYLERMRDFQPVWLNDYKKSVMDYLRQIK